MGVPPSPRVTADRLGRTGHERQRLGIPPQRPRAERMAPRGKAPAVPAPASPGASRSRPRTDTAAQRRGAGSEGVADRCRTDRSGAAADRTRRHLWPVGTRRPAGTPSRLDRGVRHPIAGAAEDHARRRLRRRRPDRRCRGGPRDALADELPQEETGGQRPRGAGLGGVAEVGDLRVDVAAVCRAGRGRRQRASPA